MLICRIDCARASISGKLYSILLPSLVIISAIAVVEIAYNHMESPATEYRAEIDFTTQDEWLADITMTSDAAKEATKLGTKHAGAGWDKILAVYPRHKITALSRMTPEEIIESHDITNILGKQKTLYSSDSKEISNQIAAYVDNTKASAKVGPCYVWPLVSRVKIFCKSPVLGYGLVLDDLPGVGDTNKARCTPARQYLSQVDHIWIVAPIVRAVDDQSAKESLG
jgi:hypothetical protein